jgi:DNA-binding LacI/PurR family transcriptional regulator
VLNDNPKVKPHLRARVEQAMVALNYQPSALARGMRSQTAQVIGLILPDIRNPFFTMLARAIEDVAHESGYGLLLCNSDEDPDKEQRYAEILLAQRVAGVIISSASTDLYEPLQARDIPLVCIARPIAECSVDTVLLNSEAGSHMATEHLTALGHRRIGLILGLWDEIASQERFQGYERALEDAGIPLDPDLVLHGGLTEEGGYAEAMELLEAEARPTALVVTNRDMALGALRAIQSLGLQVPNELSVVSYGDMPCFSLFQPSLTVLRQPVYELGLEAAKLLLRQIQGEKPPSHKVIRLAPMLVVGASTAPPPPGPGSAG